MFVRLFSLVFCFFFLKQHLSAPINYAEEYEKIRGQMAAAKLNKAEDQVDYLLRLYVDERKRAEKAESDKKQADSVIGAVAGRGAVESLYLTYVKKYLPTKKPGEDYTKFEMDKAYTDFFNDKTNDLAQALLQELPNWKSNDLAITIRKIYGKLSYADHSLFNTLKKMHNLRQVVEYIKAIGASLSDSDLLVIEKISTVLLEKDEFYTLPTTTASTSKPTK